MINVVSLSLAGTRILAKASLLGVRNFKNVTYGKFEVLCLFSAAPNSICRSPSSLPSASASLPSAEHYRFALRGFECQRLVVYDLISDPPLHPENKGMKHPRSHLRRSRFSAEARVEKTIGEKLMFTAF